MSTPHAANDSETGEERIIAALARQPHDTLLAQAATARERLRQAIGDHGEQSEEAEQLDLVVQRLSAAIQQQTVEEHRRATG